MANNNAGASFDEIIQEGRRKRQAEKLAQEIFGKKGRSSAPPSGPKASLGGSLASRVGIVKRNSPSPRATAPRAPPPRAPPRQQVQARPSADESRSRPRLSHTQSSAPDLGGGGRSNGNTRDDITNGGPELSIKGVASGPYIVVAQNFASGTTAADIEQVMLGVGGEMNSCKLVAAHPTVIAEMSFVEKAGAEKVIETFNGKKADGRPLYVFMKNGRGAPSKSTANQPTRSQSTNNINEAEDIEDVTMEVDENAESREAENRRREEHRSRDDRASRDAFPTGPRGYRPEMDRYDYRRPEPGYQDGRYGFGGRGGFRDGPRGGYSGYGRRYGGPAQSWRP